MKTITKQKACFGITRCHVLTLRDSCDIVHHSDHTVDGRKPKKKKKGVWSGAYKKNQFFFPSTSFDHTCYIPTSKNTAPNGNLQFKGN